jgi:hypothetical protein
MSLCCHELGTSLTVGAAVFCGTRAESAAYSAVSAVIIAGIPKTSRSLDPRGSRDGIDIHAAHPQDNGGRFYSLHGAQFGEFLFSIDRETALEHTPKLYATYGLKR